MFHHRVFIVDLTDPDIELDELYFHKPNSTTLCRSGFLLLIRICNCHVQCQGGKYYEIECLCSTFPGFNPEIMTEANVGKDLADWHPKYSWVPKSTSYTVEESYVNPGGSIIPPFEKYVFK